MKAKVGYILIGMVLIIALIILTGAGGKPTGKYALSTTLWVDDELKNIQLVVMILDTETGAFRFSVFTEEETEQARDQDLTFCRRYPASPALCE